MNTKTGPNSYEQRLDARRSRFEAASDRASDESTARHAAARAADAHIPLGQPILVGHHSEGRHRRDLARIDRNMQASIEAGKRAKDFARRAAAVGMAGISADDPEAAGKLTTKAEELEAARNHMKAVNKAYARGGWEAVEPLVTAEQFKWLRRNLELYPWLKRPFTLANTGARIRQVLARAEDLKAREAAPEREAVEGDGWRITENKVANRVRIHFDARPTPERCTLLRRHGFKWAPSEQAWQRQATNAAWYAACQVTKKGPT
jgi:hypothetical protein